MSDTAESIVAQPVKKKQKVKPKVTNVSEALVRLGIAMRKEEKFGKAVSMVLQLMSNNMNESNAEDFVKLIEGALARRQWIPAHGTQGDYVRLIEAALSKRDSFGISRQPVLTLWEFDVCKHARLLTDDSFAFASAVSAAQYDMEVKLREWQGTKGAKGGVRDGEDIIALRKSWESAIMAALRTVCEKHKFAWAKVPVGQMIAKAYELHYCLTADNKAQVERFQRLCTRQ